ncbi:MAG: hypothetical protein ACYC63_12595 [Armatimonadota bacterium]
MKRHLILTCCCLCLTAVFAQAQYEFVSPAEPLPAKPWHATFINEQARTPEGQPNAGAAWTDHFLQAAFEDRLQKTAAQAPWQQASPFLQWAIWAYLSPDSKFRGDERLLTMSQTWLDTLFTSLQTKPADPAAAAKWQPDHLDSWNFTDYSLPLLEIEARPALKDKIGTERVDRLRRIVLANIERYTTPEAYNKLLQEAETYVNPATHPMSVFTTGWLLTGEQKYLRMAHRIIHILGRDQLPNGMFPYRYKVYGEGHQEFEMMYYHAMNLRGLYLYWWATGSKEAEKIFRKSTGYYPLNLEWPGIFNGGPDIWWKDQWRTFWPHHIAMVGAVTGDGENAALANEMARRNISMDRIDLFLGAHAYQQMGLRGVQEKPLRDNYTILDPDIRGARLRHGRWSATYTTSSFTYTRASAMRVADDGKTFSALHLARPIVRVAPLDKPYRTEPDYTTLGRYGAQHTSAFEPGANGTGATASPAGSASPPALALGTVYSPVLTDATWQDEQPEAPWQMAELWLLTDQGLIGLIDSTATAANQARELCHQFRFIIPGATGEAERQPDGTWKCGDLRLKVWQTDLEHQIVERARRYALGEQDRRDWQLSLSDTDRSPEHVAQTPPKEGEPRPTLKLPDLREYPSGYHRYSLVEVSPGEGFDNVTRLTDRGVLEFEAKVGGKLYRVSFDKANCRTMLQVR